MAGDVALCGTCRAEFRDTNQVSCEYCEKVFHLKCAPMSQTFFSSLIKNEGATWICKDCRPNKGFFKNLIARIQGLEKTLQEHTNKLNSVTSSMSSPLNTAVRQKNKRTFASIMEDNSAIGSAVKLQKTKDSNILTPMRKQTIKNASKIKNYVIVQPKDMSETTSEEARAAIKSALDKSSDPVRGMRKTVKGKILIECNDSASVKLIQEKLNDKMKDSCEIKGVNSYLPKMIVTGLSDYESEGHFLKLLYKQNESIVNNGKIKVLKAYPQKNGATNVLISCDLLNYSALKKLKSLYIDFDICSVYEHVYVLRCFKCQCFGHKEEDCTNKVVCSKCAGTHRSNQCNVQDYTCHNCTVFNLSCNDENRLDTAHPVFSIRCPVYKEVFNKKKNRAEYFE